ncbi:crossover junction endodeoxyribonuclease RuvC [Roseivivax halotolerans]|uniref:Crossover junction endodeoxyribonuclease RuvC n=2 Tax=Roseivivax halotolerans TaxID=93684 RepID=A0A1I5UL87_9RHOB|nr:crossover junction endodeoxyribonuclease RuvC [Roseivivax halotolerans]
MEWLGNHTWRMFAFRANPVETTNGAAVARVLGIDPGLRNLGWGVIDADGGRLRHVANGTCHSEPGELAPRLLSLYRQLSEVVRRYAPDAAAVEQTFVNKDAVATLKLGQARAIALLVPAEFGLEVGEYAPNKVKKTVVGVGHAQKQQIDHMVRMQLPGVEIASPDAADALAIAICHAHYSRAPRLKEAGGAA